MKWHDLSVDETLNVLKSSFKGLSSKEAEKRVLKYGKNELIEEKKDSRVKSFILQFMDILILLLIVAAIMAYFVGDILDSMVILFVVVINAIVGFVQEQKAEKAMEKLKGLLSTEAVVIREGNKQVINANKLTIGDIVVIEEGNTVPADLRIIESSNLRIDESSITGESLPVLKSAEKVNIAEESKNIALMESSVVSGKGKGIVITVGMNTQIGKIAEMIHEDEHKTPLQEKIGGLGKALGLIALIVCTGVFLLQFLRGIPLVETFLTAISLAVAAVPEGLPAILTLTLAMGMQRMAKSNAIVRKLVAVETLGSCTVICTDKTGTLTKNKMIVTDSSIISQKAFEICTLCNNAYKSEGKIMGDPTDAALLTFAYENNYNKEEFEKNYPRLAEVPLDSTRKRMTTINQIKGQNYLLIKGAPEIIINKCGMIDHNDRIQKLTEKDKNIIFDTLNEMTHNALRVLALAYKKIEDTDDISDIERLEKNLVYAGLVGMIDPPREEVIESVKTCKKAGIKVVMITGDHKETATAIAKKIDILDGGKVLTGTELNEINDEEFAGMVNYINVYARVLPEQKVRIVNALQKMDHIVSMTGDGVNDAPALKKAAIGVSMGSGTDVAKESSDMVLQDDNFATIVRAIKEGRTIFENIRRFVKFQVSTNVSAILTIVTSSLLNLPVPFNPIQILWINLIMDGPPAQSLGVEPPESDIMEQKPKKEDIIPHKSFLRIAFTGVIMAIGTLLVYYFELLNGSSHLKATTIAFTLFVMFQIVNVFNNKSETGFSNRFLLIAVTASFILQLCVIYISVLQNIFRTTYISLTDWILILLVAPILFIIEKIVNRFEKRDNIE